MTKFTSLYDIQRVTQDLLVKAGKYDAFTDKNLDNMGDLPFDDPRLASYHVQQLISEVGEVLEADKRWKNFRNERYDPEAKAEELADCFIVLMNVAMFSGISAKELEMAVEDKMSVVRGRIMREVSGK